MENDSKFASHKTTNYNEKTRLQHKRKSNVDRYRFRVLS